MTVACVLRSGGRFDASWVERLRAAVALNLLRPHRFVCLTDVPVSCERIPLEHGWKGRWSKIELFRPGVFSGPVLYLDLDTMVTGSLYQLSGYDGQLAMLADFTRPDVYASGVMAWTPSEMTEEIYETFAADPAAAIESVRYEHISGDGAWIARRCSSDPLQELYPNQLLSYKAHVLPAGLVPAGVRLVSFHGAPSPADIGWVLPA